MDLTDKAESKCVVVDCGICGSPGAMESIETDNFTYGSGDDSVVLSVLVPVVSCSVCEEAYTGEAAEIIRDAAVRQHLASL
ncbi:YgiT-type zinc finger protein [Rhizobium sp. MHM7A]|uniref:YgiT-type zinc finger protein n=1 Tax=Rhizobium sp. MHM7A TaxID=2583233 RepID=UPI001105C42C|nr:YgiT-type zinc finger protein [Rhizobium sp. MHM7A]TLX15765.1 YgiT-type zinc finger protein [Rhizobium sp. MHM7A]